MRDVVRAFARRLGAVFAECYQAQRRLDALRLSQDRYVTDSRNLPDTYEEFLYRTVGPLRHEPPAAVRLRRRVLH
jgi:hypothetical protein